VEASRASISPLDRGFLFGEGVFETFRTFAGVPFRLPAHLRRLRRSAREIGAAPTLATLSVRTVRRIVADLATANEIDDAAWRLTVTPGREGSQLRRARERSGTLLLHARPLPDLDAGAWRHGVALGLVPYRRDRRGPLLRLKTTSYLENLRARRSVEASGAWDALFLNENEGLSEGSACNVFLVRDGVVSTPDPESGILAGVMRDAVIRLSRREAIPLRIGTVMRVDIAAATEAFVTNALVGILPVCEVDARRFHGVPGPITRALMSGLARWVQATARRVRGAAVDLDGRIPFDIG